MKETIKKWLLGNTEEKANLGEIIAPIYKEVPPAPKTGKFITEGFQSWAYIAISAIADEVMSAELELYRKKGTEWTPIEDHQALDLINKPNSFQTKEEFFWLLTAYLLAEGEAPVVLDKAKNPTSMVLVNPEKMEVLTSKEDLVTGYRIMQSDGRRVDVPKDEVVFFKLPSVLTPFRGSGVLKHISQTLDLDNFTEEYLRMFFFNSARPDMVITTDQSLKQDIVDRFRRQWERMYKGLKNSHKLAILTNGMKPVEIGSKMSDIQITETDSKIRDKVLAAFKVPKSVLGITEDVNRANGENSDRVFARRAIKPKLLIIQAQLNQFLLPKFSEGMNLWYEFENPVKEDDLLKVQIRQANITAGIRTANEYREEDGLDPVEEEPVGIVDQEDTSSEDDPKEDNTKKSALEVIMKSMLVKSQDRMFDDAEVEVFHNDKIVISDDIEARYAVALNANFERQKKEILKGLDGRKKLKSIDGFDTVKEEEILAEISIPFIDEMIKRQAVLAAALLGEFPLIDDQDARVRAYVNNSTLKLGKEATETTTKDVQSLIKIWSEAGLGIADLKKDIKNYFNDTKRADLIARTEISRAAGFATEETYKEGGAIGKKWITAPDERVCQFCREMDGKIIDIGKNFWDKGDSMVGEDGGTLKFGYTGIPAFPLHPACRCDLVPIFNQELLKEQSDYKLKNEKRQEFLAKEEELSKRLIELKSLDDERKKIGEKEVGIEAREHAVETFYSETKSKLEEDARNLKELQEQLKNDIAEVEKIRQSM